MVIGARNECILNGRKWPTFSISTPSLIPSIKNAFTPTLPARMQSHTFCTSQSREGLTTGDKWLLVRLLGRVSK